MTMLKAGLAVAMILIGAIAVILGATLLFSALKTGTIQLSYGTGAAAQFETITQAGDASRFWQFAIALGAAPLVLGAIAVRAGWRAINSRGD
jgi:FlaG/FlaF family flagellin (archaellin)